MVAESEMVVLKSSPRVFDARSIAQMRTLYLVQGLAPIEIERMGLGFSANQVSTLANREGWTTLKKQALEKVKKNASASVDASVDAISKAIAMESEELCFDALKVTRQGLSEGGLNGARQAQAASAALKNLAGVVQVLRNPGSVKCEGSAQINLFMIRAGDAMDSAKAVSQVTEIESKP